jgi:hypothetical protein
MFKCDAALQCLVDKERLTHTSTAVDGHKLGTVALIEPLKFFNL